MILHTPGRVSYEVGLERSFFDAIVLDLTGYYKDIRNTIRTITIETPNGIYRTNGNGDYADVRGVELSDADFAATYEMATKMDPSGLVSVESFRRALNAATMPEGQQTVSRYPFAS